MTHRRIQAGYGKKKSEEPSRREKMEGVSSGKNRGDQGMAYWNLKRPR